MGMLFLLFTLVPAVELFVLIEVGQIIGAWDTIFIVVATGVIGAYMARTQGLLLWLNIQKEMARGRLPADHMIQGFLVFLGGVLLITPGFITDAFGLALVFPLTRMLFVSSVKRYFQRKVKTSNFHIYTNFNGQWHSSDDWRDVTSVKESNGPARVRLSQPH